MSIQTSQPFNAYHVFNKGAFVIGTTSTEAKAAIAKKAGADEVILYSEKDFVEEVNRITDGKGVNVIYDGVGKTTFLKSKYIFMENTNLVFSPFSFLV